jgi:hypothetical protein
MISGGISDVDARVKRFDFVSLVTDMNHMYPPAYES